MKKLSKQEQDYIRDMAPNFSYKSIAQALNITVNTVAFYADLFGIKKNNKLIEEITKEKIKNCILENLSTDQMALKFGVSKNTFNKYLMDNKISIKKLNLEITEEMLKNGISKEKILEKLQISEVTFYNRLKVLKRNGIINDKEKELLYITKEKEKILKKLSKLKFILKGLEQYEKDIKENIS